MWQLIEDAARDRPGQVLFRDDYGRSLTTEQYRAAAERVAAGLGVAAGQVVSWQLPTVLEAPVLLAALARVGAVQNPLITILRDRELRLIAERQRPSLVIAPERWRGFDHGSMVRSLAGPEVVTLDLDGPPAQELRLPMGDPSSLADPPSDPGQHRWTYFSSGTTAEPKGARHSDRSVIAGSFGMTDYLRIGHGDVYPIAWPYPHIGGAAMTATVLKTGATLVLFDNFDDNSARRMAAHHPTVLGSAVPFFRAFLGAQASQGKEPLYPALRMFTAGGAPTPAEVVLELMQVFGVPGLHNAWGLTEFPIATSARIGDPTSKLVNTAGRPCPGVQLRVVEGELRLKGPQCFLGYLDDRLDADAFDEEGWFRTGDLGQVDVDGYVSITGRSKDVIIRNAENISAIEVEAVLSEHPDIVDVAVVGLPDPVSGERVCAVIVSRPGREVTLESISSHCGAAGLARQKMPERLEVVDALPRNAMGKVLKQDLRAAFGLSSPT